MKPKRAKNAFFQQEKSTFTEFFKGTAGWLAVGALLAFAVMILIAIRPVYANPTDWHNHDLSEQISRETRAEMRKLWREENGDWQPNLTKAEQKRLLKLTGLLQAERDKEQTK